MHVASGLMEALELYKKFAKGTDRFFFGSLSQGAKPLTQLSPLVGYAHVLIGPEGDLSYDEERTLTGFGFEPFTLGSNRLRAETAACAAITAIDIFARLTR